MNRYSYSPIDSAGGQIRLLTMPLDINRRFKQDKPKPLTGTLTNHYLPVSTLPRSRRALRAAQLPMFWALSYVWGRADPSSTQTYEVLIDGKRLAISRNLYDALHAMHNDAYGDIRVWADAICICQEDVDERSAQILLMSDIYNIAADVKIWLGHLPRDGKRCLKFINDLTSALMNIDTELEDSRTERIVTTVVTRSFGPLVQGINYFNKVVDNLSDVVFEPARTDKAQMVLDADDVLSTHEESVNGVSGWRPSDRSLRKVEKEDFQEMADLLARTFMQHEWFSRMWVVQEMGVSNSSQFLIGGVEVSTRYFLRTLYYLHFVRKIRIEGAEHFTRLTKMSLAWKDGRRQPLRDLIRECRYRKATDPRDKIFSLLGLMGDPMTDYLRPDYTKPLGQVYADATRHFLQQYKTLDVICGWETIGRQQDQFLGLPSWAPDYNLDQRQAPAPLVSTDGRESIYAASGHDQRSEYRLPEDPTKFLWRELDTLGLCVASVAVLSDPGPKDASFASIEKMWLSTVKEGARLLGDLSQETLESLELVSLLVAEYCEWFSADKDSRRPIEVEEKKKPCSIQYDKVIDAYTHTLLSGRASTRERVTEDFIREILRLDPSGPRRHNVPMMPYANSREDFLAKVCNAFESGVKNRQFAITDGGYMGALPQGAMVGDLVCVLYGCSVPVLLRKRPYDGSYRFLGECYLHGFMDAEAIVLNIKGVVHEETFVLR
ncbi:hypothetical protein V495_08222 [Pseudogymnoascus sp. VKM F-4514 (FW-929)]|nr:hypothetical protein V495_08222 [Pseudogymnoascus sp. VKM F-4514 (FW-929)]KFY56267.1 hypothetical protein V497_06404 [Pseudogymnoascus sp. VKM F-4516 (FW-969)]